MPADFDRGVEFVREHGGEFDQARLYILLGKFEPLTREQEARFLAHQRADGGWGPFWAQDYSSLDATCFRLAQGALILGLTHPALVRALDFFCERQRADGSWEEDESVRDVAPPWAKPDELATRLYLTANCGWWLALASSFGNRNGDSQYRQAAERAATHLRQRQNSDGMLPSFLHTYWLASALWISLNESGSELPSDAQRTLDHLATLLEDETPSGALGWLLTTLAPLDVPRERPAIARAVALLTAQQRPDGGWTSEDGPERDAYVTVQALLGLGRWDNTVSR